MIKMTEFNVNKYWKKLQNQFTVEIIHHIYELNKLNNLVGSQDAD